MLTATPAAIHAARREEVSIKRILLTGMSGAGKSTLIEALAARGYAAVDADGDAFSHWVPASEVASAAGTPVEADRDWVWREDRIERLLSTADADVLVIAGCAANMRGFLPRFDLVVLVSAPAAVLVERLASRTGNAYGKRPDEVERVLDLLASVEPRLRRIATHELDTNAPLEAVLTRLLGLIERCARPRAASGARLRLVPIAADGGVAGVAAPTGPAAEVGTALAALYQRVGYRPPWIGYLAEIDGEIVGTCAFKAPPGDGRVEIAYASFPGHEGQGLATRMAGELLAIARRADPDLLVSAQTLPRPSASTSILRRLGFTLIGEVEHPEDGVVWEWRRPAAAAEP